jgi:hypothetical protein
MVSCTFNIDPENGEAIRELAACAHFGLSVPCRSPIHVSGETLHFLAYGVKWQKCAASICVAWSELQAIGFDTDTCAQRRSSCRQALAQNHSAYLSERQT